MVVIVVMWGNCVFQNLGRVGFKPPYYRVKAIHIPLGITLMLFASGVGYSNLILHIYKDPRGSVITVL
jgi:hypothetical protein